MAAGSADGTVWMWNAQSGEVMQVFSGNAITSTCGSFTLDGKQLVSGGDGVVIVWNPKDGTSSLTYGGGHDGSLFPRDTAISLALHPALPVVVVGFSEGAIIALHLQHRQIISQMQKSDQSVEQIAFMDGKAIMVTAGLDGTVNVWDSNNYRERTSLKDSDLDGITSGCWLEGREGHFAVGCLNGTVAIWDIRSNQKLFSSPLGMENDAVFDLVHIPPLNLLLACHDDGKIRVYRI